MSEEIRLNLPLQDTSILQELYVFDRVLLSGSLLVGRDQVHKRLYDMIAHDMALPIQLQGQMIYYMGPSPAPEGMVIGSCGPTTSARMDPFAPMLLDHGLCGMIGKGPRSQKVVDAIIRNKAVYLQAYGGCGALYASTVQSVQVVAFAELGPEALLRIEVKDFPALVAIDGFGNGVY